ncbi:ribonuclease P protein subunit p25-like protein [Narcine bancroftii]|uniref:ribonuclease P protein subunit p25-like protein n=1 Tax=Narcine bancroftii TaxID=1343680 RepID=UPI003831D134
MPAARSGGALTAARSSGEGAPEAGQRRGSTGAPLPFGNLPEDLVEMRVKEGSKIRNLMGFALGRMEQEGTRQMVFTGSGRATTKTITCVEIMKRRVAGLHQITRLRYRSPRGLREPPGGDHPKDVPAICILLSKEPLDPHESGYQPPDAGDRLWDAEVGDGGAPSTPRGVKRSLGCGSEELGSRRKSGPPPPSPPR